LTHHDESLPSFDVFQDSEQSEPRATFSTQFYAEPPLECPGDTPGERLIMADGPPDAVGIDRPRAVGSNRIGGMAALRSEPPLAGSRRSHQRRYGTGTRTPDGDWDSPKTEKWHKRTGDADFPIFIEVQ
jgi:hypothetical protein